MTEYEKSREKFEEALFNLEKMVESIVDSRLSKNLKSLDDVNKDDIEDPVLLKKERDELKVKLNEATDSYVALSSITSQLSNRLDNTIKKLKIILEQ